MKNFPPKTTLFVHSRVSAQLSANLVQIFGTSAEKSAGDGAAALVELISL